MINLEGKSVFLSGPMTGWRHNNVAGFAVAHAVVRGLGARQVYSPGRAWLNQPLDLDGEMEHEDYMVRCLHELTRPRYERGEGLPAVTRPYYDVLVSLPGWETSAGAVQEREVASCLGMECVELVELEGAEGL